MPPTNAGAVPVLPVGEWQALHWGLEHRLALSDGAAAGGEARAIGPYIGVPTGDLGRRGFTPDAQRRGGSSTRKRAET